MRRRVFFGIALAVASAAAVVPALVPSTAAADPAQAEARITAPPLAFEKYKLANGLEVILHEDHRTPIVSTNIWYHVGSKDEPAHRNGFAHLFEHVMFQGTKHLPEDTWFRYLERVGATDINGTTADDRTNYFETIPANRLELALWMESDRMGFLLDHVDEKTFASQREVVKNERRQNYENAPYGLVSQYLRAALYPASHPYHLLTIGTPEDLDSATLDDVKTFFRTWYLPNNATLVIAGDFKAADAKRMVEKYFAPIPAGVLPPRRPVPPIVLPGDVRLDVKAGVELPRVFITWPTPAYFTPGDGELDLLAHALTAGKTSRLYKRLVYDMQIAADVSAGQDSNQLGSQFEIVATAKKGHTADELLAAIDDELEKVRSGGLTEPELSRAKTVTLASLVFGLEFNGARADMLNRYNQHTGDPGFLPKDLGRYQDATADKVKEIARAYLPAGKRVVALVTPDPKAAVAGDLAATTVRKNAP